jgi:hypothetical protein
VGASLLAKLLAIGSQTTIRSINEHSVDYRIVWPFSEAYSAVIPALRIAPFSSTVGS